LREGEDYVLIGQLLWDFLYSLYNCDHPIKVRFPQSTLLSSHRSEKPTTNGYDIKYE